MGYKIGFGWTQLNLTFIFMYYTTFKYCLLARIRVLTLVEVQIQDELLWAICWFRPWN